MSKIIMPTIVIFLLIMPGTLLVKGGAINKLDIEMYQLTSGIQNHVHPSWSNDENRLVTVVNQNQINLISIIDVKNAAFETFNVTESAESITLPQFCLNSTAIVYQQHIGWPLVRLDIATKQQINITKPNNIDIVQEPCVLTNNDSRAIAVVGHYEHLNTIVEISLVNGDIITQLYNDNYSQYAWPSMSRDNKRIIASKGADSGSFISKYCQINLTEKTNWTNKNVLGTNFKENYGGNNILCLKRMDNLTNFDSIYNVGTLWIYSHNFSVGQPFIEGKCAGYSVSPISNRIAFSRLDNNGYYQIWIANYTWVEVQDTSYPWELIGLITVVSVAVPTIYLVHRNRSGKNKN